MSVASTRSGLFQCLDHLTVALRFQYLNSIFLVTVTLRCSINTMADDDLISKVMSEMGRRGGQARAKALTAKQRRESAIKASKAAAKARIKKAQERKRQEAS